MTQAPGRASIVLDTCCVINLGAARDLSAMLAATPCESWMPSIAAREALHIRQPDPQDPAVLVTRALDLTPAIDAGHLHLCDLDGDETALFVAFAAELDDGEAAALAVAKHRDWPLATDDPKARRIATDAGVALLSTPELTKAWADETKADVAAIKAVVTNIRTYARFVPRAGSPQADWWARHS